MKIESPFPMKDCHPTINEITDAETVFLSRIEDLIPDVQRPEGDPLRISPELAVRLALSEVWRQARIFQRDRAPQIDARMRAKSAARRARVFTLEGGLIRLEGTR